MASPCTACVILNALNIETLDKVARERSDFSWELVQLMHPKDVATVEGLEVEKMPAVLINGEQITAGTILSPRALNRLLDTYSEEDGLSTL